MQDPMLRFDFNGHYNLVIDYGNHILKNQRNGKLVLFTATEANKYKDLYLTNPLSLFFQLHVFIFSINI